MEIVCYGVFTAVWWITSITLWPAVLLVKYFKFFRDKWFSWFVKILHPYLSPKLQMMRKKAFMSFDKHWPRRNMPQQHLEVLEIGIGGGEGNLKFYPENTNLTALDMDDDFKKPFTGHVKKNSQINSARAVVGSAEDMHMIEDSSMDFVVSSYVLCSVQDVHLVLKEVKRVLKPGGKFLFLEHVAYSKNHWSHLIVQKCAAPLWKVFFYGCVLDRDIGKTISQAVFSTVEMESDFPSSMWLFIRPQIFGVATK
ncbi:hypothetical protein JTE90_001100 [Oedothorax gibbosus]|uniref:Methyltransferase type 11 domain-containing protein n=1 Tax=Oedothorax gibbosus TaxID=931172 RepID=A0AAV6VI87_9ARAC|nr:hypothetical protein JTE90_001100 [Oedothorax gibbosus]